MAKLICILCHAHARARITTSCTFVFTTDESAAGFPVLNAFRSRFDGYLRLRWPRHSTLHMDQVTRARARRSDQAIYNLMPMLQPARHQETFLDPRYTTFVSGLLITIFESVAHQFLQTISNSSGLRTPSSQCSTVPDLLSRPRATNHVFGRLWI